MNYRLFIDDERFPISPDWFIARTSSQAIKAVRMYGLPQEIAFDHDLGEDDTSIAFLHYLEYYMLDNELKFPKDFIYTVHSQNPVGAANIASKMDNFIKYFGYEE